MLARGCFTLHQDPQTHRVSPPPNSSQWEYQVGPCKGIESGDQLWMSRFLLERIAEEWGITVSFHPKPLAGDWNGAGCHTVRYLQIIEGLVTDSTDPIFTLQNYSTNSTRSKETGMASIKAMIDKLSKRHKEHIAVYGSDNEQRLTGAHETGHIGTFNSGVANRGASIRIPRSVEQSGSGYCEYFKRYISIFSRDCMADCAHTQSRTVALPPTSTLTRSLASLSRPLSSYRRQGAPSFDAVSHPLSHPYDTSLLDSILSYFLY